MLDGNFGYPSYDVTAASRLGMPYEGHSRYAFEGAIVEPTRIRLRVALGQFWRDWCELQYPVPRAPGSLEYACAPDAAASAVPNADAGDCVYDDPVGGWTYTSCGRAALCADRPVCACTSYSCEAATGAVVSIDFAIDGANGSGTIDVEGLHNMHVTRR